jgi:hypothetical protein
MRPTAHRDLRTNPMSESTKPKIVSRRNFAAVLAGTGAAAPLLAQQQTTPPSTTAPTPAPGLPTQGASPQRPGRPVDIPPFQDPIEFKRRDVAPKVHPFPMTQVRLLPGPFQDAQEWNRSYICFVTGYACDCRSRRSGRRRNPALQIRTPLFFYRLKRLTIKLSKCSCNKAFGYCKR